MWGKFLHGRPRMLTRDLFAVANLLVTYCSIRSARLSVRRFVGVGGFKWRFNGNGKWHVTFFHSCDSESGSWSGCRVRISPVHRCGGLFCRRCLGDAGLVWYADHRNHGETRPPTAAHVAAAVVSWRAAHALRHATRHSVLLLLLLLLAASLLHCSVVRWQSH